MFHFKIKIMARVDIYDLQWIEMVFAGRNQKYGAYSIRKETSRRNVKSLAILALAMAVIGGGIAYDTLHKEKVVLGDSDFNSVVEVQSARKNNEKEDEKPKINKQKEVAVVRRTQKFTPPVIRPDELVNEKNVLKQMDALDAKVAIGEVDMEGTNDRSASAMRAEVATVAPPAPAPALPEVDDNKVQAIVEQMPSFPGGPSALMNYLQSNVKYPVVAQETGVQGRVIVGFVVEKDGSITDVKVLRSVDPSLDREAMRVVKGMPRWSAGRQNGRAVRVRYNVPVSFRLQ